MSKPRSLADECTFIQAVRFIRALGFHVERTQELGLRGAEDTDVLARAQERRAVLVTNDRGFGNTSAHAPSSHQGVIVLKMPADPQAVGRVHGVLRSLLEAETRFEGALFIVDANKYRIRRTP